ncbi:MAG: tetratricopeptide repeat protein [Clostridium sp.]|uniref:tetratricopeptide repeat protein n=1 Tax=Clostridium sp. TaxID=1506 RepID=UPI003F376796
MKILKGIANIVLYLMLGGIYIVSLFTENKKIFYGVTILILFNLIYSIIRNGYKLKNNKDKKVLSIGIITINCISLILSAMWIYTFNNIDEFYKIINEEYYASFENEEYNKEFMETNYENYKIIHRDNMEAALPIINGFIGEIESKSKSVFGEIKEPLTIKFDYDKNIFHTRLNNGHEVADGYYIPDINTIYMYADDAFGILGYDSFYRDILSHEVTHHYYYQYIKNNNIAGEEIPLWFSEGLAEYLSSDEVCIDKTDLKFTPFKDIEEYDEWNNIESGTQYIQSVYTINKLVDMKGKDILNKLILNTKEDDFSSSFEKIVGISLNDFEKEVKKDIENSKSECYKIHKDGSGKYLDIKIKGLEDHLKKYPNSIETYVGLSTVYLYNGRNDDSIEILKRGIKINPDNEKLKRLLKLAV